MDDGGPANPNPRLSPIKQPILIYRCHHVSRTLLCETSNKISVLDFIIGQNRKRQKVLSNLSQNSSSNK
jgi:hypothetical protein